MFSAQIIVNTPGTLIYAVVWDPKNGSMDIGTDPEIPNFVFEVDGVPRLIQTLEWTGGNELAVEAVGAAASSSMKLIQQSVDPNVLNTDGVLSVPPEEIETAV